MTSEMASLDISIPPRTHCSAARSCGGVRSNSPPRGASSATLMATHLPVLRTPEEPPLPRFTSVLADGADSLLAVGGPRPIALCTGLWTACAHTPLSLCAGWGCCCGQDITMARGTLTACADTVHRVCEEKTLRGYAVHTRRNRCPQVETLRLVCPGPFGRACRGLPRRLARGFWRDILGRPAGGQAPRRMRRLRRAEKHHDHDAACLGFDCVFDAGSAARQAPGGHRRGRPGRAFRPGRAGGSGGTGRAAGRSLGHDRGTGPGAGRAPARLLSGYRLTCPGGHPPGPLLLPDDLDFDRGGHLGVQPHLDLMRPDGLDRAGQLDPAPVEFGPPGGAHGLRDVGGADRAEQAPGVARLDGQADVEPGEPFRGCLGLVEAADVPGRPRP